MKLPGPYRAVLITLLTMVVLNLTNGFIAYRYLGKIDADYSEALDNAIMSQNMLRTVSMQATRTLANTMLFINKDTRTEDRGKAIRETGEVSDAIYEIMGKGPFLSPEMERDFEQLRQKRVKWRSALAEDLEIVKTGNDEKASFVLKNHVYPLLVDYLDSLDRYCAANQSTYSTLNQKLTQQTTSKQHLLFGVSALPVILFFSVPTIVLVLVILLVMFLAIKPAGRKPVNPEEGGYDLY